MEWVDTLLQGVLLGGLYALFATGLSLIFGVMRLVNIAHGDLIVLAAFVALVVTQGLGLHPLLSLLVVVPAMASVGYGLQRGLLNRTLGGDILPPLLVTFGLSSSPPTAASCRSARWRPPACSSVAGWPSAGCR